MTLQPTEGERRWFCPVCGQERQRDDLQDARERIVLLVCGSRDWTDQDAIADVLADYADRLVTVIHGGARGADLLAADVAQLYGYEVRAFPADWELHGKRAGILRNLAMLDQNPDRVLAFRVGGSRGTTHTIEAAKARGIPVEVIDR